MQDFKVQVGFHASACHGKPIFKIKTKNVNENVSTPPSVLIFTLGSQGSSRKMGLFKQCCSDFGHARSSLVGNDSGPFRKRTLSGRTKNPPGAFITFRCRHPNPSRSTVRCGVWRRCFPPQEPRAPEGAGPAPSSAPPLGVSRSALQAPGFAGEPAGRRGADGLPVPPPRPASRLFPLLVPRTGPRVPFPGGPRAWRRPAGKLTRDSCSLPPAAPRASDLGRCGFSTRLPSGGRRPEA